MYRWVFVCAHNAHIGIYWAKLYFLLRSQWGMFEGCQLEEVSTGWFRKAGEVQSPSSCLTQSFYSGNTNLRISSWRLHVLTLFSGGLYSNKKKICSWTSINSCTSSCGLNFVLLSVMFLISFGKVFMKPLKIFWNDFRKLDGTAAVFSMVFCVKPFQSSVKCFPLRFLGISIYISG